MAIMRVKFNYAAPTFRYAALIKSASLYNARVRAVRYTVRIINCETGLRIRTSTARNERAYRRPYERICLLLTANQSENKKSTIPDS